MSRVLTVLHTSDWQCGRPFLDRAADALVRLAEQLRPDVLVVSGDVTQRAKKREFRAAAELIARLPSVPTVWTPGNHDVPLYRIWERLLNPFANWRRQFGEKLDTVTRVDGATFVALNSAAPRRAIVNGRLSDRQMDFAEASFAAAEGGGARVLVVHHHFVPVPDREGGSPLPGAQRWLKRIEAMGVDVVLGGHVHQTHLKTSQDVVDSGEAPGVPIVACGTTTSRRGRGVEEGWNSLNLVRISDGAVEVTPYRRHPEGADFEPTEAVSFESRSCGGHPGVGVGGGQE